MDTTGKNKARESVSRRIRSIKPEILDDERTAALSHGAWRLFVSLWLLADDYGNFRAVPRQIGGAVFWGRDDSDAGAWLNELVDCGLVATYSVKGQRYGHISGWHHQKVDKPGKPLCPGPDQAENTEPGATPSRDSRETLEKVSDDTEKPPEILAPDLDQDPDQDLEKDPDPDTTALVVSRVSVPAVSAERFVETLAEANLATGAEVSPTDRQRWARLSAAAPVTEDELAYAVNRASEKKPKRPVSFVLGTLEGQREDAARVAATPKELGIPGARASPRLSPRGETIRRMVDVALNESPFEGVLGDVR